MKKRSFLLLLITATCTVVAQKRQPTAPSQQASVNNGLMIQNNKNVVIRREAAKANGVDELGWMRVLTPEKKSFQPLNKCEQSAKAEAITPLFLRLGSSTYICTMEDCKAVAFRERGKEESLITLHRKGAILLVVAKIFDEHGQIVFEMVDNKPHVNKNFVFDAASSAHSLSVRDNRDKEVLSINFRDPRTVEILGDFHSRSGRTEVLIKQDAILLSPGEENFSGLCSVSSGTPFVFEPYGFAM